MKINVIARTIGYIVFFVGVTMAKQAPARAVLWTDAWWGYILGVLLMWAGIIVVVDYGTRRESELPK